VVSPYLGRVDRQGWIALGLSFLILFASLGIRMSFGAYVTAWELSFGASRSQVSLVSSVSLIVYGLGMPVVGRLVDRYGARLVFTCSAALMGLGLAAASFARSMEHLLWLYSVVASLGFCGASSVTASVALINWFPRNRALAVGASSCGIAAGGMFLAPLTIYLIHQLGWRQTLLLLGLTCLFLLTAVMWVFFHDAPAEHFSASGAVPQSSVEPPAPAWPLVLALALAVPYFVCGFTDLGLFSTHFVPLAEGRGISAQVVALAISINYAANLGGNLLTGHLADRMSLTTLLSIMYLWRALGLSFLITAVDPTSILIFAALNGAVEASTIAPTAALCAQLYGPRKVGTAYGLLSAAHQFGAAAGAFVIGALYVRSHSYHSGLILSVALLVIAGVLTQLARRGSGALAKGFPLEPSDRDGKIKKP